MSLQASSQSVGMQKCTDEETFYMHCRAAYLTVFRSSLASITSKHQLCRVLQQAGRNPSQATLNKHWTPRTTKLNFDDFCEIVKSERPTEAHELMRAFRKMDINGDGYISHSELHKVLTSFCRLLVSTAEQCQIAALERLEADAKLKRQNFGNELDSSPKSSASTAVTVPKTEPDTTLKKDSRSSSRPSSARSRRSSLSNAITMAASNTKNIKLAEHTSIQDWHHTCMKGSFFLEEDGGITSLQYHLTVPQTATVYLTISPLNLSQRLEKPSSWMSVDTAVFVVSGKATKEDSTLVCFTESRDKEKCCWKGELSAGTYCLLPFTTGCRLRRRTRKSVSKAVTLVNRTDTGELDLTRDFRGALSDIFEVIDLDGNGLLSLEEYNFFELRTSGEKCDEDAWAVCKENFDTRKNQLSRQGFMELNLMEASEREGDPTDLWVTLEAMGYNRDLEMVEACPFLIDVYCEEGQCTLQPVSLESGHRILNTALQRSITARSEVKTLRGQENVLVYTYRGEHRISTVIANKTSQKVTVHVNNEQSKNCSSSRGMSVFAVEVPARTKMVCQHVLPINERQEWTYSCVESIIPCQ
ncbi:EF-hand calcium-binding domain-containing protein 7 isoform X2 [Coregonus clupeaformis]|uniref:EF-hand calcium-binding domain-containing protein 7 isoform X2 n=1 Tax=Coregonus clupeaformis TaxID=59861 RepID=UPI001BDFE0B6|nr:EF-hand calcium-binding domain-containing protein 7 isoform X2 [Coregonus clupeaformis]